MDDSLRSLAHGRAPRRSGSGECAELTHFSDPRQKPQARWRSSVSLARNALYRGNATHSPRPARGCGDAVYRDPNAYSSLARCWKAEVLLEMGRPGQALQEARLAQTSGAAEFPELKAIFVAALAHEGLGESSSRGCPRSQARGDVGSARQKQKSRNVSSSSLRGRLALARHNLETQVSAMRRAAGFAASRKASNSIGTSIPSTSRSGRLSAKLSSPP